MPGESPGQDCFYLLYRNDSIMLIVQYQEDGSNCHRILTEFRYEDDETGKCWSGPSPGESLKLTFSRNFFFLSCIKWYDLNILVMA
jgi:hypothetical protein